MRKGYLIHDPIENFIFESFYSGFIKQSILHMSKNFCGVRVYSGGWGNSEKIQGLKIFTVFLSITMIIQENIFQNHVQ